MYHTPQSLRDSPLEAGGISKSSAWQGEVVQSTGGERYASLGSWHVYFMRVPKRNCAKTFRSGTAP